MDFVLLSFRAAMACADEVYLTVTDSSSNERSGREFLFVYLVLTKNMESKCFAGTCTRPGGT